MIGDIHIENDGTNWEKLSAAINDSVSSIELMAASMETFKIPAGTPEDSFPITVTSGEVWEITDRKLRCSYCGNDEISKWGGCEGCGNKRD